MTRRDETRRPGAGILCGAPVVDVALLIDLCHDAVDLSVGGTDVVHNGDEQVGAGLVVPDSATAGLGGAGACLGHCGCAGYGMVKDGWKDIGC